MAKLHSQVSASTERFQANAASMQRLIGELQEKTAKAALGGPESSRTRHAARGKLLPRERVEQLVDPGSPFLELSPLAAEGMYDGEAPAAGVITGIGRVSGRECVIVCNDATVKGGAYFPITVKKHLRAQEVAIENSLPCVYLVDSGGANLPPPVGSVPGPRALRANLLQPGQHERAGHPAGRGRDGIVHGGRRLCAGHVGRDSDRAQAGHDLPRWTSAGEGRDRARSSRQRILAGPMCTRAGPAWRITMRRTMATRCR